MPTLDRDGAVYLLRLGDGENRLTPDFIAEVSGALDEVAAAPPPAALVTYADGKIWSNGLDLDWMLGHPDAADSVLADLQKVMARLLRFPTPTVAAVQGHAFAAGAMFALAHDSLVMRQDRGFICLPEVNLGIPFTAGMTALIQARLSHRTAQEAMTTGRRYGGADAAGAGLADVLQPAERVLPVAVELAGSLASTAGPTLGNIKSQLFSAATELLLNGPVHFAPPASPNS